MMELLERLDQQIIDGQPDRPAPVRVAAKHVALRFSGIVADDTLAPIFPMENVGMFAVRLTQRAHSEVTQEFIRIQHPAQETFHSMTARDRNQAAIARARLVPA